MINLADEQLVAKYLQHESEAMEILIQRYLNAVYGFIFKYVPNQDEAEDITQEVFIKTWRNINSFKPNYKFKTWLFTIAKNTALDHLKKKKPLLFSALEKDIDAEINFSEAIPDYRPNAFDALAQKAQVNTLELAMENIPVNYKATLDLRYNQELKFREIAELLNLSIDTVKTRHGRALKLLKRLLS